MDKRTFGTILKLLEIKQGSERWSFLDHDRRNLRSHAAKDDEAMQFPASFKWFVVMRITMGTIGTSQRERGRSEILKIGLGVFLQVASVLS